MICVYIFLLWSRVGKQFDVVAFPVWGFAVVLYLIPLAMPATYSLKYLKFTETIGPQFGADVNGVHTINPNDFEDPLTFPLARPWVWHLVVLSEMSQHLLDGSPWNLLSTFMSSLRWVVITSAFLLLFYLKCQVRISNFQYFCLWPNTCKTNDVN